MKHQTKSRLKKICVVCLIPFVFVALSGLLVMAYWRGGAPVVPAKIYAQVPQVYVSPHNIPLFEGLEKQPLKNAPKIAIVIDDMGLSQARLKKVMALPGPLTLSFLPYGRHLQRQADLARAAGHELMLHMPMEPFDHHKDPGPVVLRVGDSHRHIHQLLEESLSKFSGFVGINNHMGSKFTSSPAEMAVVMDYLKDRHLLFLDSFTAGSSVGVAAAQEAHIPYVRRDIFIDHDEDTASIDRQLEKTLKIAKKRGFAVAIGHPKALTLASLQKWLPRLRAEGVQLVPISEILHQNQQVVAYTTP